MTQPENFREILQQYSLRHGGKRPTRLLACGYLEDVNSIIVHPLHVRGFAEVGLWSPPLPSPLPGEIIRILTMYGK